MGALKAAETLGYLRPDRAPPWITTHTIRMYGRLYLVGRYLQIFFGLALLVILWGLCRRRYGMTGGRGLHGSDGHLSWPYCRITL